MSCGRLSKGLEEFMRVARLRASLKEVLAHPFIAADEKKRMIHSALGEYSTPLLERFFYSLGVQAAVGSSVSDRARVPGRSGSLYERPVAARANRVPHGGSSKSRTSEKAGDLAQVQSSDGCAGRLAAHRRARHPNQRFCHRSKFERAAEEAGKQQLTRRSFYGYSF